MRKPSERQRLFAENYVMGMTKQAAALAAGYSPAHAAVQGAKMMQNKNVQTLIRQLRREMTAPDERVEEDTPLDRKEQADAQKNTMPGDITGAGYTDPKDFLMDVMNKAGIPLAVRADAAFKLMPYMHARVAEKGKKESRKDRAAEVAGMAGGGSDEPGDRTRSTGKKLYAPKKPPQLSLVGKG